MDIVDAPAGTLRPVGCPRWCVAEHGVVLGEEDGLHVGARHPVRDDLEAWLCMSTDAAGAVDGPYVVVGAAEYTLDQARALGISLLALTEEVGTAAPAAG